MKLSSKSFYKNLIQEEVDFCLRYANLDERERTLFLYRNVDTPTAKAMGFLFLRPLHCRKDFSFT